MYEFLKHAHSGWRWVLLLLLLAAIGNAFMKWRSKAPFQDSDRKLALFALIATHIQLVFGLVLYFISPRGMAAFQVEGVMKEAFLRFHAVEHISAMIIGVVLITIGFSRSKRKENDADKFRLVWMLYLAGLVTFLIRIPWPFQSYGAGWF